jgi:hypothetical protein
VRGSAPGQTRTELCYRGGYPVGGLRGEPRRHLSKALGSGPQGRTELAGIGWLAGAARMSWRSWLCRGAVGVDRGMGECSIAAFDRMPDHRRCRMGSPEPDGGYRVRREVRCKPQECWDLALDAKRYPHISPQITAGCADCRGIRPATIAYHNLRPSHVRPSHVRATPGWIDAPDHQKSPHSPLAVTSRGRIVW